MRSDAPSARLTYVPKIKAIYEMGRAEIAETESVSTQQHLKRRHPIGEASFEVLPAHRTWLTTTAVSVTLLATSARAQSQACTGPRFDVDPSVSATWQAALVTLQDRLHDDPNVDQCAKVEVRPAESGIAVRVSLPDGRIASRRLEATESLSDTIQALVELPPQAEPSHAPADSQRPTAWPTSVTATNDAPARTRAAEVELDIGGMGRVAAAPWFAAVGVAGLAQMHIAPWLVGIGLRWETDQLTGSDPPNRFEMETSAISLMLGRRLRAGVFDIDALIAPELVVESQDAEVAGNDLEGSVADVRFDAAAHLVGPRSWNPRLFGGIDADISPARLGHERRLDDQLPALPAWSTGATLGVAWSPP